MMRWDGQLVLLVIHHAIGTSGKDVRSLFAITVFAARINHIHENMHGHDFRGRSA